MKSEFSKVMRLFLTLSLVFCILLALPLNASAASTETQDGLEVTIITDKIEYTADEDIRVSVTIKNNNSYTVEDVSIETLLPEGLILKNGNLSLTDIDIEAGNSYSASVVAQLSEDLKDNEEDEEQGEIVKPEVDNENANENTNENTNENEIENPQTGDTNIVLWISLIVTSVVGIVLAIKFKKTTQMMCLILCLAMLLPMLPMSASAEENDTAAITVEKTITVDGKEYCIKVNVHYLKIMTPDDVTDLEDTEVSIDSVFKLFASEMDVVIGVDTPVVFYVNSDLTIPNFELYCDGISTGVMLYDDGDYKNHNDDIPNDGCYTGVLKADYNIEKDYNFTAKAVVGNSVITTNVVKIFAYYEFSDEQLATMEEIESQVADIIKNKTSDMGEASEEEKVNAIRNAIDEYLYEYIDNGTISNLEFDQSNYTYTWYYPTIGIDTFAVIYEEKTDVEVKENSTISGTEKKIKSNSSSKTAYSKGEVVVLNTYEETHSWSLAYDNISNQLSEAGFSVTNIYNFTCEDFMSLQDYNSLILLNSHGNTLTSSLFGVYSGSVYGKPMICTEEMQTPEKNKLYAADLKKNRIEKVTTDSGSVYWIAPELFEDYYKNECLSSPIVYLGCCRSYCQNPENTEMVEAIYQAGATAVLAYSASVSVAYDNDMAETLVDELLQGNTARQALVNAQEIHGQEDYFACDNKNWGYRAQLNLYGEDDAVLYHDLRNGNFDDVINLVGSGLLGWKKAGDARSVMKLSGILPLSTPKMAIISSGFGSMDGETTSFIHQTFLVPGNADSITFSYNVVSEEPMEYVGSEYNDSFKVELLDTSGNVLEILAFESVNSSTWYEVNGIDFPGGDDTTFHTRWKTVTSDVMAKYAGTLVVLKFTVEDAGDSIYDTAALIDSIVVN